MIDCDVRNTNGGASRTAGGARPTSHERGGHLPLAGPALLPAQPGQRHPKYDCPVTPVSRRLSHRMHVPPPRQRNGKLLPAHWGCRPPATTLGQGHQIDSGQRRGGAACRETSPSQEPQPRPSGTSEPRPSGTPRVASDSVSEEAAEAGPLPQVWVSSDEAEQEEPQEPRPSGTSPSGVWVSSHDGDAEQDGRAEALHGRAEARERCAKRPRSRGAQSKPEGSGLGFRV